MDAGQLNERFAFDRRGTSADGYGNTESTWIEQFRCAVRRQMLRGGENVMAARLEGRDPAIITVRRSVLTRQITADWRCRDTRSDDVFNIRSITPRESRDYIDLLVERGAADG